MGVSTNVLQVIENNRSRLINDLSLGSLIIDLRSEGVLNDDDVHLLQAISQKKAQNHEFLSILIARDDQSFYKFCNLLVRNPANAIKNFGNDLLQQINYGN